MKDSRFPWIEFPAAPKIGQRWVVRSLVLPLFVTWEYQEGGWQEIDAS